MAVTSALAACGASEPAARAPADLPPPAYGRTDVIVLDRDIVGVLAEVEGAGATREAAIAFARCVAAGYAVSRGFGFARHLRTTVAEAAGVFTADALYSVSPEVPPGLVRIDAEVTAAECAERGVPTA